MGLACSTTPRNKSPGVDLGVQDLLAATDLRGADLSGDLAGQMVQDLLPLSTDMKTSATPMKIISQNVPAFSSATSTSAAAANDNDYTTSWRSMNAISSAAPATLAYDLSGVLAAERKQVLVVWYNTDTYGWDHNSTLTNGVGYNIPGDYTLEANTAAGANPAPTSGWDIIVTVTANTFNSRQHVLDLSAKDYNWVRMRATRSDGTTENEDVDINMDVYDVSGGATDSWLFLGDSITAYAMKVNNVGYSGTAIAGLKSFAQMINAGNSTATAPSAGNLFSFPANPDFFPAQTNGGIGGTTAADALETDTAYGGQVRIDYWLAQFPGKYVCLSYGSNDVNTGVLNDTTAVTAAYDNLATLVQKVIAAGKVPCIPHMPWANTTSIQSNGPLLNAKIDMLYATYPSLIHGPDLFTLFENNQALISADNLHPADEGDRAYRQAWAQAMIDNVYR